MTYGYTYRDLAMWLNKNHIEVLEEWRQFAFPDVVSVDVRVEVDE